MSAKRKAPAQHHHTTLHMHRNRPAKKQRAAVDADPSLLRPPPPLPSPPHCAYPPLPPSRRFEAVPRPPRGRHPLLLAPPPPLCPRVRRGARAEGLRGVVPAPPRSRHYRRLCVHQRDRHRRALPPRLPQRLRPPPHPPVPRVPRRGLLPRAPPAAGALHGPSAAHHSHGLHAPPARPVHRPVPRGDPPSGCALPPLRTRPAGLAQRVPAGWGRRGDPHLPHHRRPHARQPHLPGARAPHPRLRPDLALPSVAVVRRHPRGARAVQPPAARRARVRRRGQGEGRGGRAPATVWR